MDKRSDYMNRLFQEHIIRKTTCLDGAWQFSIDPEDKGEKENWHLSLPQWENTIVPSVWNTQMGLLEYEGAAWYEKSFYTNGGTLRFIFEAVMTKADVWLDGEKLGEHYGGFCQFEFIATNIEKGMHTLIVRADNRFDNQSIPMAHTDWWHYGGIPRSVSFEELEGLCPIFNHFDYTLSKDRKSATGSFTAEIFNAENKETTSPVSFIFEDETVWVEKLTLKPFEKVIFTTPKFEIDDIRLWAPETPNLYEIGVLTDTDDLIDKTGLRSIEVKGTEILLNGKAFEIRGINRHEENTDFGFAFPAALMKRDIDIIKNMYANSIRGAHYPNSRTFLDMLDEEGLTFWSEIPMWGNGYTPEVCGDEVVIKRAQDMHKEMVHYYYNHPSIIIWGMHNEMPTFSDEVHSLTDKLYSYLKKYGGNRLVAYACDKIETDICFNLSDIICINRYDGWYYGDRNTWEDVSLSIIRKRLDETNIEAKPMIISEFGAAAIYGHHTFDDLKWTEEYQADMLEKALRTFKEDPIIKGYYIWQFCDIRTSPENGLNRARHYNNKGILNEYRRPKQAYFAVRNTYKEFAEEGK